MSGSDHSFRSTLVQITDGEGDFSEAIRKIEELRLERPHTIELFRQAFGRADDVFDCLNCHAFTFGLGALADFSVDDGFPSSLFVERWMLPRMRGRAAAGVAVGDVIVYFNDMRVAHSGRVIGHDRIQSKWGQIGHAWNHGTFEVPASYGQRVEYFEPPSTAQIEQAYIEFKAASDEERYPGRAS